MKERIPLPSNPYEFINIRHKCGKIWRVTRNSLKVLWCPYCKTSKGFKEISETLRKEYWLLNKSKIVLNVTIQEDSKELFKEMMG